PSRCGSARDFTVLRCCAASLRICSAKPACRRRLSFFFSETSTTEIYTLSLHDALPIFDTLWQRFRNAAPYRTLSREDFVAVVRRSEEHTSELQSPCNLVCRLLLEKKKSRASSPARAGGPRAGGARLRGSRGGATRR